MRRVDSEENSVSSDPPRCAAIFFGFMSLSIIAFGGVLPLTERMLVDRRRWMTEGEFLDVLSLCQFLPGGNIINLSVAVGMKFQGVRGAVSALLGLTVLPTLIVISLAAIYDRYQNVLAVQHLFAGLAAAAAGLLIAMSIRLSRPLLNAKPLIIVAVLCFVAVAVFRLPLLPTMLSLTPISAWIVWRCKL